MANYFEQATDEVAAAKENSGSDNGGEQQSVEQIEVDMESIPFVKFYPTTALTGTFPEDEGNPIIRFPDQKNNGHSYQGYLGLVVDDLSIDTSEDAGFDLSESTIIETDGDDYTEYRAVNFNDDSTTEKYGGDAVNIDGDQYGVEDMTTQIDGRSILVVDRTSAVSVAKKLDVNGATSAGMDESTGQPNSGLIEYAPTDEETEVGWQYARNPELRDELLGEEVTVLVSRREEIDSGGTGYVGEEGQHDEPVVGFGDSEETHTDPNEATYEELTQATTTSGEPEARGMMWYTVFDSDDEALSPVEGEATGRAFLEWRFDPTVGRLPEDEYEFVVSYENQNLSTDEETIVSNIQENFDDANEERIIDLIQNDNDHTLDA
jgi:hypothetical protein